LRVDEYGKYVQILGYRLREAVEPKAFIETARNACRPTIVQFLDAEALASENHLFFATLNAIKAFTQGRSIAQSLDVEILLYASAQNQIGEAIRTVGLKPQTSLMAVVLVGEDESATTLAAKKLQILVPGGQDNSVLGFTDLNKVATLNRLYGINTVEVAALSSMDNEEALQWLIVERTALLDARR
jgi:tRNA threonylcarbamoyladenosine modification (KEOPS) complex Cgi121 subunit